MTRDEIISQLYTGKNFCDCLAKMEPEYLREDLRQEVITIVCGWDDDKVKELHGKGELEFYVVRVILNQIQSKSSPFYRKYRGAHQQLLNYEIADQSDEERELREQLEDTTIEEIDKLYWYDAELIRIYMRVGNFRGIQEETGIPFISCYKNIKKSLVILKARAMGEAVTIFNKEELRFIQNNKTICQDTR